MVKGIYFNLESTYPLINLSLKDVQEAYRRRETITGYVKEIKDDELIIRLGDELLAHLPFSEVTIYPLKYSLHKDLGCPLQIYSLLNKNVRVQITSMDNNKITVSRKKNMEYALEHYETDSYVDFEITNIDTRCCYGVCNGGLSGMLNEHNISASLIHNVNEYFHVGDVIRVKVLYIDELGQLVLSYKDTFPTYNPYNYKPGDHVICSVGEMLNNKTGYFVNITPNIKGIVDINETVPTLHYGQKIECIVKQPGSKGLKLRFLSVIVPRDNI